MNELVKRSVQKGFLDPNGRVRKDVKFVRIGNWKQKEEGGKELERETPMEVEEVSLQNIVAKMFQKEFGVDVIKTKKELNRIDNEIDQVSKKLKKQNLNEEQKPVLAQKLQDLK